MPLDLRDRDRSGLHSKLGRSPEVFKKAICNKGSE